MSKIFISFSIMLFLTLSLSMFAMEKKRFRKKYHKNSCLVNPFFFRKRSKTLPFPKDYCKESKERITSSLNLHFAKKRKKIEKRLKMKRWFANLKIVKGLSKLLNKSKNPSSSQKKNKGFLKSLDFSDDESLFPSSTGDSMDYLPQKGLDF